MAQLRTVEKSTDKRKAILDACLKLFNETCFQYTSTASISQEAGVATGTLFLYFENKEVLVNELYLECKDEYASFLEEGIEQHQTFKSRLRHIWDRTLDWKLKNPQKIKFMMQFCTSPLITNVTKEKAMSRVTLISDVVKDAIANNEVKASSAELLAAMISGYFHSASLYLYEHPNRKNLKKWSEESFEFLWHGIN